MAPIATSLTSSLRAPRTRSSASSGDALVCYPEDELPSARVMSRAHGGVRDPSIWGAWIPIARRRVGLRLSNLSYLHHALSRLVDSTAPADAHTYSVTRAHARLTLKSLSTDCNSRTARVRTLRAQAAVPSLSRCALLLLPGRRKIRRRLATGACVYHELILS